MLGELIACQGEAWAADADLAAMGNAHAGLPGDLLNFHYDPVTCAAALGWPGAATQPRRLRPVRDGDVLRCQPDVNGRHCTVVTAVDGDAFTLAWLAAVEAAASSAPHAAISRLLAASWSIFGCR
jgi:hypothetical protein